MTAIVNFVQESENNFAQCLESFYAWGFLIKRPPTLVDAISIIYEDRIPLKKILRKNVSFLIYRLAISRHFTTLD